MCIGLNMVDSKAEKRAFFSDKNNSSRGLEGSDPMSAMSDKKLDPCLILWKREKSDGTTSEPKGR